MVEELQELKQQMEAQLHAILLWWIKMTIDEEHGGFYGKIDHSNRVDAHAPKGAVLNSRILWSFSSAFNLTAENKYLQTAQRAFRYIIDHFIDPRFGGVFWTVDYTGAPLITKKQIYALAFAIYGLSEYYLASRDERARKIAIELYYSILTHSHDATHGGYVEALTRDWKQIDDLRLSEKDANEKKSMNTHLHLLEAFANLFRIWKNAHLKRQLTQLVNIFLNNIIDNKTNHLILFFDDNWNSKSRIVSYGHDIEAAWLIQEATELVNDELLLKKVKQTSLLLADAAIEGLDEDGGLWYEFDNDAQHLTKQKHSWPQAEAMIGFFNAWQITSDEKYLKRSLSSWLFVKKYILDEKLGEWYWGVQADHSPILNEEKAGIWKCPYHNSRACMEIIRRIQSTLTKTV